MKHFWPLGLLMCKEKMLLLEDVYFCFPWEEIPITPKVWFQRFTTVKFGHTLNEDEELDTHNQAGIAHNGGLVPLLKLFDSKNGSLQHNAAFALYGLADNEDNVVDFIKVGGLQKLQDGEFIVQATKDCVAKTIKRLEENIKKRVLNRLLYLMRVADKACQRRVGCFSTVHCIHTHKVEKLKSLCLQYAAATHWL